MLQSGARNMQNLDQLRAVGRTHRPVVLKRGHCATLDELLAATEYPDPTRSVSDAEQALSYDDFTRIMHDVHAIGGDRVLDV